MCVSTLSVLPVTEDGVVTAPPGSAGTPRRSFTPAQKLKYLSEYEAACETRGGGAYLRRHGLYSSQVFEWRRQRDAGLLAGKDPGSVIGVPSREQAEIARLKRALRKANSDLETTRTALEIMGKAHALLEQISKSAEPEN